MVPFTPGSFTTAGDVAANHIARWDGATSSWHPLGSGTDEVVFALAVDRMPPFTPEDSSPPPAGWRLTTSPAGIRQLHRGTPWAVG